MKPAALSTMWLAGRFSRLSDFVSAGLEMGFPWFELNYQVTPQILGDLQPGEAPTSSAHYPFPRSLPEEAFAERDIQFSSTDESRRRQAVEIGKATIDAAQRFGGSAVVLHMGLARGCRELEMRLRELVEEGGPGVATARARLVDARAQAARGPFRAARRSLQELSRHAERRGIRLGLENRVHYYEIPTLPEMELLLGEHPPEVVGYWHDVGHAELTARIGFDPPLAWLGAFGPRMVGVHLHDVRGFQDHLVAGAGEVDFGLIRPHIPEDALRVCEFDQRQAADEVRRGLSCLRELGLVP